ncbi:MAG TPA: hypothetical protein PKB03_08020 [Baekduia sp.]|nr:hypothetical protein [Baekduia sp.]
MAAGVAHIPFYATAFRGDELAGALADIAPVARRYNATWWSVHRSVEDAYSMRLQVAFPSKQDWDLFWNGSEMQTFRAHNSGAYQVPLMYSWFDVVTEGPDVVTPDEAVAASAYENAG